MLHWKCQECHQCSLSLVWTTQMNGHLLHLIALILAVHWQCQRCCLLLYLQESRIAAAAECSMHAAKISTELEVEIL